MNAPDDVAAAYREFVEARGESPTDMSLIVECSGSIRQDLMEAMRGEVLKIKPPMATVVFDEEINTISPRSTYLPRKERGTIYLTPSPSEGIYLLVNGEWPRRTRS